MLAKGFMFLIGLTVLFLAAPSGAKDGLETSLIADVVVGDWNNDGVQDAAILTRPVTTKEDFGLTLFLKDHHQGNLKRVFERLNFIWGSNALVGQEPTLKAAGNGSLRVQSKNETIGRNRWKNTVTIAYRQGNFVIAGFTHEEFDTLQPRALGPSLCDLNLLTGKGVIDARPITFKTSSQHLLSNWDQALGFDICNKRINTNIGR